jgi:hypothetical protein
VASRIQFTGKLFTGRATLGGQLGVWINGPAREIRDDVRALTPRDTGVLRTSIVHTTRSAPMGAAATIGSKAPDVLVNTVEGGRRAGARMPPPGALLGWMGRKGIPASKEWSVRKGIAERGIPGVFMFARTFERWRSKQAELARSLGRFISTRFA